MPGVKPSGLCRRNAVRPAAVSLHAMSPALAAPAAGCFLMPQEPQASRSRRFTPRPGRRLRQNSSPSMAKPVAVATPSPARSSRTSFGQALRHRWRFADSDPAFARPFPSPGCVFVTNGTTPGATSAPPCLDHIRSPSSTSDHSLRVSNWNCAAFCRFAEIRPFVASGANADRLVCRVVRPNGDFAKRDD